MNAEIEVSEQQPAPDFTLPAIGEGTDKQVHLASLKGKTVVLYFYPKDDTPGCTTEACNFRDMSPAFRQKDVVVLGVSADDVNSHQKFADKYHLPFPLLADPDALVAKRYGSYGEKNLYGRKIVGVLRKTFLIDKEGVIRKIWRKVKPDGHANEVLETIESLQL
jgi:peroxiredoxin Q/BCP